MKSFYEIFAEAQIWIARIDQGLKDLERIAAVVAPFAGPVGAEVVAGAGAADVILTGEEAVAQDLAGAGGVGAAVNDPKAVAAVAAVAGVVETVTANGRKATVAGSNASKAGK